MVYIKVFLIVSIIFICFILGNKKANSFKEREMELKNIKDAFQIFINKIEYTYSPIAEIFEEISKIVYQDKSNIFQDTINLLKENRQKSISNCFYEAVEKSTNFFHEDDKEIIKMLGRELGKTNKDGQISEIQVINNFLETQIGRAEEEKVKNVKLYKTLGTIIGCGIGIILF